MHLSNIYKDGELDKGGTYKKFLLVRQMMPQGRVPGMIELTLREWAFFCLIFGDKDFYL